MQGERTDDPGRERRREPAGEPRGVGPEGMLRRIEQALEGLRYGSVLAIVQDGVIVQIERTEKTRYAK